MRLLRPEQAVWLLAAALGALCWSVHFWLKWRARRATLTRRDGDGLTSRRTRRRRDAAVLALALCAIGSLTVAMMRPQRVITVRVPVVQPRDLIVVLDRSASMRARDVAPSRFGRAIDEVQRFLAAAPPGIDRVALIGFAGASVVLSYPTRDFDSVAFFLEWARDDPTPLFGTNIGGAITTALDVVRREQQAVTPVFVLISDGEDQSGRLDEALRALVRAGIRVHAIGVGTDAPVPMPVTTGDGREEFLRDDYGEIMVTQFTDRTLQQVAAATGGQYFRAAAGGELLRALAHVAAEEGRPGGYETTTAYRDVFSYFLAVAAAATLALVTLL